MRWPRRSPSAAAPASTRACCSKRWPKCSADSAALRTPGLKHLVPDDFPQDAFPTDYAIKDIRLALELAEETGVNAEAARHTCTLLEATSRAGYGKNYYPAMVKLIGKA